MKKRKGYRHITVNGREYLYRVSVKTMQCIFYNEEGSRIVVRLDQTGPNIESLTQEMWAHSWRGKRGDNTWGKRVVAALLRDYILKD